VCAGLLDATGAIAQTQTTRLRGTVRDAVTGRPVAGASVSVSGDVAQESEVTDDLGFFRILIRGVAPGDLVRIRVRKDGYVVYDRQVVSSEEQVLEVSLRSSVPPTKPAPPTAAPSTAAPPKPEPPAPPVDPIVVRFISQMDDPNVSVRRNALKVLAERAPASAPAMSTVIAAALNGDSRVRTDAAKLIGQLRPQSKDAVTNLIIGLDDVDQNVRWASTEALKAYPKDSEAIAALLMKLGTPPSVNTRAMNSLTVMGVNDPRLAEALFHEATLANDAAIAALLKRAPFSGDLISRMTLALTAALDSRFTTRQQALLDLMLKGGGVPARGALRNYLSIADDFHRSRLVLSWLELDRTSGAEMLELVPRGTLVAEFTKGLNREEPEEVLLRETRERDYLGDHGCSIGVRLRSAMGVLVLDLPPSEDALKVMEQAMRSASAECGDYAAIMMRSFKPTFQQRLIPALANTLVCENHSGVGESIAVDTLAELGDEQTITLLHDLHDKRRTICGNDDIDPLGSKKLGNLVARIRARIAANR
jgi:HEAT repeat protein